MDLLAYNVDQIEIWAEPDMGWIVGLVPTQGTQLLYMLEEEH
jgi:hypothetical protein